jgi:hypothetical protein
LFGTENDVNACEGVGDDVRKEMLEFLVICKRLTRKGVLELVKKEKEMRWLLGVLEIFSRGGELVHKLSSIIRLR